MMLSTLTPWQIISCLFGLAIVISVVLQNLLERRQPEGKDFERGFDAGLEQAARIVAATGDSNAESHARTIRAARRDVS